MIEMYVICQNGTQGTFMRQPFMGKQQETATKSVNKDPDVYGAKDRQRHLFSLTLSI